MGMLWMSVIEIEKLLLKMREREMRVYMIRGKIFCKYGGKELR